MNWQDIERSLDSEIERLQQERLNQIEQDEKFAELVLEDQAKLDTEEFNTSYIQPVEIFNGQLMQVPAEEKLVKIVTGRIYSDYPTFDDLDNYSEGLTLD